MAASPNLGRRSFLKHAGGAALAAGAAGAVGRTASASPLPAANATRAAGFDFDTVYDRWGTNCVKFDQQIRIYGRDSVKIGMGIADMDFRAAPAVTKALAERLRHENWGYLDMVRTQDEMAEAIVGYNRRRYGLEIDPATIELSTGVHAALCSAFMAFCPRGSRVLLQAPVYDGFYSDLKYTGTRPEESPLRAKDGRFEMDFEDFERRIGHDTNVFLLCNPHNPTGSCWSPEELTRIGDICLRRRVIVLADEIHCDFVSRGQKYTPFASLKDRAIVDNSLTFKAASKSFGLSAHKVGWFHSTNPALLERVRASHRSDLTTLGIVANVAALRDADEWLDALVRYIEGNHDFAQEYLADRIPTLKATKPQGTYLVWVDASAVAERIGAKALAAEANRAKPAATPDLTPENMVERFFVRKAGVQLNSGSNYGPSGANRLRMNVATPRRQLEQALASLAAATKTL
jgi:cystathionine beta-lyase